MTDDPTDSSTGSGFISHLTQLSPIGTEQATAHSGDKLAQANRELDLLYRSIAHARNGIIITDCGQPDHPIIYANEAFLELTGYGYGEVIGRNCRFLQGPDTDPSTRDRLRESIQQGQSLHVEIRNYRKDGSAFWNDLLISPIHDDRGQVTHFIGNQIDASRRIEAEADLRAERDELERRVLERTEALRAQNDYLAGIVETIRESLLVLDTRQRVVSANDAFYQTFKVSREETEGRYLFELGNGQWNIPKLAALLNDVLPEHRSLENFEVEHEFPEIGRRIMIVNARQVRLRGTGQERILVAIEDATDRRRAEDASLRSAALTDAVLSSLSSHIAVIDQHGTIIAVNDAWTRFGRQNGVAAASRSFIGVNYLDVLRQSHGPGAAEAPEALRGIEAVMAGDLPVYSLEYPCDTLTENLWFLLQVTPLRHAGGGAVISHIDITDRKRIEARKDDFISMASHELKTPITSMKLFVQTMRRKFLRRGLDEEAAQLTRMDAQVDKLTRLVQELLDVSRIYAGKLRIRTEPFDLVAVIHETAETLRPTAPHLTLEVNAPSAIPILGDADRIEQVLVNLLTNAIKYSPHGGVIEVLATTDDEEVTVSVRDRGIGIDASDQVYIFERFYQAAGSGEQTYPGLGMGLYISAEIVKHHNGTIWVDSEKGQGSTFSFSLPRQPVHAVSLPA